MPKLTASSGTNPFITSVWKRKTLKEIGGGQGLKKTIGTDYITSVTYDSIFEFAKAQNKYYADARSTQHNDKMLYQSYDGQYIPYKNVAEDNSLKTLQDVSKHTLELLVNTCKEEVNKNIKLTIDNTTLKNKLTVSLDKNVMLTLENRLLKQGSIVNGNSLKTYKDAIEDNKQMKRYTTRLEEAEKNRKDPHHREQLIKYSLLMLFGFILFGLIKYL